MPLLRNRAKPSAPTVPQLVVQLKEAEEDFEFYPTTDQMIQCVLNDYWSTGEAYEHRPRDRKYNEPTTVLDVGAGHGAFLKAVQERSKNVELLAIEKSNILISQLITFAKVIGTDFHAQSYLDKNVDILFCNPPYKEYATWVARLIRECPARTMYFVIPQRWKDDAAITAALAYRNSKPITLGSFDFLDAERAARAKVDVICLTGGLSSDELFDKFFQERFGDLEGRMRDSVQEEREKKQEAQNTLVARSGLIQALVTLYEGEMLKLQTNYDLAAAIDPSVLHSLHLTAGAIVASLKEALATTKNRYWSELFDHLDSVTRRLTVRKRQELLNTIAGFKSVDFNETNIYAVLCWVMENANKYIDVQILEVFDAMIGEANIKNYKSNQRVYGKGMWRYGMPREEVTHVSLDFRIVLHRHRAIVRENGGPGLAQEAAGFISDLLTVANLLNLSCAVDDPRLLERSYHASHFWKPGTAQLFQTTNGEDLLEVRAFLNGNMHLRLSQEFSLKLNVMVGKLRGWVRDHKTATEEFGADAEALFDMDPHLKPKHLALGHTAA